MKFDSIKFEEATQTYRSVPQNYWLASIKNDKLVFDSWDGAIKKYSFESEVKALYNSRIEKN